METSIHLCVGAKGTRNIMIYASSKLDMLIMIKKWSGCKACQCVVCHILCRAFDASMQAKQLQPQSLFDAAHCDDKTREQHALTLDGVASMQAKQLQRQFLLAAAHCDVKTREQHALTLDGGSRCLPPLALSMVQLEDGLPV